MKKRIQLFMISAIMPCLASLIFILKVYYEMTNFGYFDFESNLPFVIFIYTIAGVITFAILLYVKVKKY